MNSTSIYILVALHPIITLTNMPNTAMEATELLKEIQKHDSQQAFRSLYDMYYDRFFRIAFYYLQRDEWAQEVILDVFTTLWNHRKSQLIPDDFNKYSYILIRLFGKRTKEGSLASGKYAGNIFFQPFS